MIQFDKEFIIEFLEKNGYTVVQDVEVDNARITGAHEEGCVIEDISQDYINVFTKVLQNKLLGL